MYVDEPRCDGQTRGINRTLPWRIVQIAYVCNSAGTDAQVRALAWRARAVDYGSVRNDNVVRRLLRKRKISQKR